MRSGRSYAQRQTETLEGSFDLEEPEDSEPDFDTEQGPARDQERDLLKDQEQRNIEETGEQTDTLSFHSNSSTPTTADVADVDVETISSLPLSPPACKGSQLVKRHSPLKDKQLASTDTTSSSASTSSSTSSSSSSQQPDLDDVPTVSGCHRRQSQISPTSISDSTNPPQSSRYAAAAAHPSAAFAETAASSSVLCTGGGAASGRTSGGGVVSAAHRRTHSAASYISMRSQAGGSSDPQPERPKRNRFFEWLRVTCKLCCCKVGLGCLGISCDYNQFKIASLNWLISSLSAGKENEIRGNLLFFLFVFYWCATIRISWRNSAATAADDTAPSDIGAVNERKQFRI